MIRLIIFSFTLFIFVSCSKVAEKGKILLYNDYYIELLEGEEVVVVNDNIKEEYLLYRKNSQSVIPLYRCVEGSGYKIFIGLPFREDLESINQDALKRATNVVMTDSSIYFSNQDSLLIYEFGKRLEENMVYFTCKVDADTQFNKFSHQELNRRIIKKSN